jgi:hypothetical protein
MQEVCYCGRRGDVEDREPVWRAGESSGLRSPECGHLDFLPQLDAYARRLVFGEAERRWLAKLTERVQMGHGRKQVA